MRPLSNLAEGQMMSYEERKTEAKRQEKSAGSAFARAVSGTLGRDPHTDDRTVIHEG